MQGNKQETGRSADGKEGVDAQTPTSLMLSPTSADEMYDQWMGIVQLQQQTEQYQLQQEELLLLQQQQEELMSQGYVYDEVTQQWVMQPLHPDTMQSLTEEEMLLQQQQQDRQWWWPATLPASAYLRHGSSQLRRYSFHSDQIRDLGDLDHGEEEEEEDQKVPEVSLKVDQGKEIVAELAGRRPRAKPETDPVQLAFLTTYKLNEERAVFNMAKLVLMQNMLDEIYALWSHLMPEAQQQFMDEDYQAEETEAGGGVREEEGGNSFMHLDDENDMIDAPDLDPVGGQEGEEDDHERTGGLKSPHETEPALAYQSPMASNATNHDNKEVKPSNVSTKTSQSETSSRPSHSSPPKPLIQLDSGDEDGNEDDDDDLVPLGQLKKTPVTTSTSKKPKSKSPARKSRSLSSMRNSTDSSTSASTTGATAQPKLSSSLFQSFKTAAAGTKRKVSVTEGTSTSPPRSKGERKQAKTTSSTSTTTTSTKPSASSESLAAGSTILNGKSSVGSELNGKTSSSFAAGGGASGGETASLKSASNSSLQESATKKVMGFFKPLLAFNSGGASANRSSSSSSSLDETSSEDGTASTTKRGGSNNKKLFGVTVPKFGSKSNNNNNTATSSNTTNGTHHHHAPPQRPSSVLSTTSVQSAPLPITTTTWSRYEADLPPIPIQETSFEDEWNESASKIKPRRSYSATQVEVMEWSKELFDVLKLDGTLAYPSTITTTTTKDACVQTEDVGEEELRWMEEEIVEASTAMGGRVVYPRRQKVLDAIDSTAGSKKTKKTSPPQAAGGISMERQKSSPVFSPSEMKEIANILSMSSSSGPPPPVVPAVINNLSKDATSVPAPPPPTPMSSPQRSQTITPAAPPSTPLSNSPTRSSKHQQQQQQMRTSPPSASPLLTSLTSSSSSSSPPTSPSTPTSPMVVVPPRTISSEWTQNEALLRHIAAIARGHKTLSTSLEGQSSSFNNNNNSGGNNGGVSGPSSTQPPPTASRPLSQLSETMDPDLDWGASSRRASMEFMNSSRRASLEMNNSAGAGGTTNYLLGPPPLMTRDPSGSSTTSSTGVHNNDRGSMLFMLGPPSPLPVYLQQQQLQQQKRESLSGSSVSPSSSSPPSSPGGSSASSGGGKLPTINGSIVLPATSYTNNIPPVPVPTIPERKSSKDWTLSPVDPMRVSKHPPGSKLRPPSTVAVSIRSKSSKGSLNYSIMTDNLSSPLSIRAPSPLIVGLAMPGQNQQSQQSQQKLQTQQQVAVESPSIVSAGGGSSINGQGGGGEEEGDHNGGDDRSSIVSARRKLPPIPADIPYSTTTTTTTADEDDDKATQNKNEKSVDHPLPPVPPQEG